MGFIMNLKRIIAVLLIFSIILTGCIGTNVKAAQEDSNAIGAGSKIKRMSMLLLKPDKIVREKKRSQRGLNILQHIGYLMVNMKQKYIIMQFVIRSKKSWKAFRL